MSNRNFDYKQKQRHTEVTKLCDASNKDCSKRVKIILDFAETAFYLSEKEEYKPLYDANFLELSKPYEPQTSKMIAKILQYKQNGDYILLKSFIRRFLCPIGFKEEWISNPIIESEKDHMDIRILDKDKKYAILVENKLKGAAFQRNQLGRYIAELEKFCKKGNIYIIIIPGHISGNFISNIPKSVWKFPQKKYIKCEIGSPPLCSCDKDTTIECNKETHCKKCKDFSSPYNTNTIDISRNLPKWLSSATGLVEKKQSILISSMTLLANYIRILYKTNFSNNLIMDITNHLSKILFKNGLTTEDKLSITSQRLLDTYVINEALATMIKNLIDEWYYELKKIWNKIGPTTNDTGYCIIIKKDEKDKGLEIGFWNGEDNKDEGYKPYWGVHCIKGNEPLEEQKTMVDNILTKYNIDSIATKKDINNGWIAWNNWDGNKQKINEICSVFYEEAKKLNYSLETPSTQQL